MIDKLRADEDMPFGRRLQFNNKICNTVKEIVRATQSAVELEQFARYFSSQHRGLFTRNAGKMCTIVETLGTEAIEELNWLLRIPYVNPEVIQESTSDTTNLDSVYAEDVVEALNKFIATTGVLHALPVGEAQIAWKNMMTSLEAYNQQEAESDESHNPCFNKNKS